MATEEPVGATVTESATLEHEGGEICLDTAIADLCDGKQEQLDPKADQSASSYGTSSQANSNSSHTDKPSSSHAFQVDTTKIHAVPLAQQAAELQELGLTVFNQDEFEQGVMAQVDHALAAEESERLSRMLKKEQKAVQHDIRATKQELSHIDKVLSMLHPKPGNREIQRKIESVKRQKDNKVKQLKKLKAKEKSMKMKLDGNTEGLDDDDELLNAGGNGEVPLEQALGLGVPTKETNEEKMIRLGEMTPFGTVMNFKESQKATLPKKPKILTDQESDFGKFLMDQEKKNISKKSMTKQNIRSHTSSTFSASNSLYKGKQLLNKSKSDGDLMKPSKSSKGSGRKESQDFDGTGGHMYNKKGSSNLFDIKDKRNYRPSEIDFSQSKWNRKRKPRTSQFEHNFREDGDLDYGDEPLWESEDEYIPDEEDLRDSWLEEEDAGHSQVGKKVRKGKTPIGSVSSPEIEEVHDQDDSGISLDNIKSMHGVKKRKSAEQGLLCRSKDDGNEANYIRRMKKYQKERALRRQQAALEGRTDSEVTDSDNDMEFEGGFRVPGRIWNKLYRYQKTGVKWLWELHQQRAGGIVGDEMGLGKTIQIIAFLAGLRYSKLHDRGSRYKGLGPTLIVCPATVMHQWVREFHVWEPEFRVAVLHGTGSFVTSEESLVHSMVSTRGVIVTSYSSLVLRQEILLQYDWHYIVLDEGHKIRNPDAQVTIACKQFRTCHRVILSGSPVQNNLKELWSLFDFIFPGKLGTLPDFMQHFSVPIVQGGYANATQTQVQTAYKCACVLRDTINPYLLRRMKSDVKTTLDLPQKNEQVLFCRLTEEQKDVYKEYLASKECNQILSGNFMVFPGLITLRKVCNHPDISTGGPENYLRADEYQPGDEAVEYGYWRRSGKMIVIQALLELWHKQGHRVLLFTQSRQMLNILEKFVDSQGYSYLRMDGSTSISARQPLINKFNGDPSYFVFLLTTRVGGLGVNLTGADRVVIYDPDWNPSTDTQARERAWRIGQTKQVTVYRLLTTGTIEEKIYHRQIFKTFLTNRVLKDPKQRRFFKSNDLYELFTLNCDENQQGTETSAIFAGTGSDVKIPKKAPEIFPVVPPSKPARRNMFDVMREKKQEEEKDSDEEILAEQLQLSDEKMDRMRELARKLSQKLVTDPNCGQANGPAKESEISPLVSDGALNGLSETAPVSSQKTMIDTSESISASISKDTDSTKKKSGKKKKKKKKKNAKIDGERISFLDKRSAYQPGGKAVEETDQEQHAAMDDYVLHKLFKKSGVHSAMQHDKIMNSSNPDFAIIEAEAERVAKQAVRALKQSRTQCHKAAAGIPTWTGQSGGAAAARPRFGQKKNSRMQDQSQISTLPKKKPRSSSPSGSTKAKHFDGSLAGSRVNVSASKSTAEILSSSELLARMRARNHMTTNEEEEMQDDETVPEGITVETDELLTDIRNFIAFQARVDGEAATQELLDAFGSKLPPNFSAKFKAMLKQLCNFVRKDGIGVWKLKPEFR